MLWTTWLWWITGYALAALGAVVVVWVVRRNRRLPKRHCPRCRYDMAGVSLTCPECGHIAADERELARRRPRWRWMIAGAALAFIGTQVADQPDRAREGWTTRIIPSTVLALAAGEHGKEWFRSLPDWRRPIHETAYTRRMWTWQRALAGRVALRLRSEQVPRMVVGRVAWTADEAPTVRFLIPDEVCSFFDQGVRTLTITSPTHPKIHLDIDASSWGQFRRYRPYVGPETQDVTLPTRPIGEYLDTFVLTLRNGNRWTLGRWGVDVPTQVVPTPEQALPAVDSPQIRDAILGAVTLGTWDLRGNRAAFPAELGDVPLRGVAVVDGQEYPLGPPLREGRESHDGAFVLPIGVDESRVLIRLWSDRAAAFSSGRSRAFWSGTIEIPATKMRRRETPRSLP